MCYFFDLFVGGACEVGGLVDDDFGVGDVWFGYCLVRC